MPEIDSLNAAYFLAGQSEQARELAKQRKNAAAKPAKGLFSSLLENQQAEPRGLEIPPEFAKLPLEDAIVKLKDALDIAGDELKELPSAERFAAYKKTVKDFVSYVINKNYAVEENTRTVYFREHGRLSKKEKRLVLVKAIDEKLDRLAQEVLAVHADKLNLLAKIEEINGIVIDLLR
jgi:uncharacterized protein YaaR (DUF327 family)